jgi:hypothetical protein
MVGDIGAAAEQLLMVYACIAAAQHDAASCCAEGITATITYNVYL